MRIRKSDIKAIQAALKAEGFYKYKIDGLTGPQTEKAVNRKLNANVIPVLFDPVTLSRSRRLNMVLQIVCKENGFDPGPLDGYFGSITQVAATLLQRKMFDQSIPHFDELEPIDVNPNNFPSSRLEDLSDFYGDLSADCTGLESRMKKVPCPWKMKLDWNLNLSRSFFRVHEQVADSLERVVNKVFDHYQESKISRLGLDRFSGDYVPRKMRGSRKCSTHAWGIAIDMYGSKNGLKTSTADTTPPTLASSDLDFWWKAWEEEGWYSLGRMEDRDWMHIQAAKGNRSRFYHR